MIHSDIHLDRFVYRRALVYLSIVAGLDTMRASGLGNLLPKWRGERVDSLRVSGLAGKNME